MTAFHRLTAFASPRPASSTSACTTMSGPRRRVTAASTARGAVKQLLGILAVAVVLGLGDAASAVADRGAAWVTTSVASAGSGSALHQARSQTARGGAATESGAAQDANSAQPDDAAAEDAGDRPRIPQVVVREVLPNGVRLLMQETPGVEHVGVLAVIGSGEIHDPADAPGLARVLANLVMTSGVDVPGMDATANPDAEPRLIGALDYLYRDGWAAQALPERMAFGVVVPSADADEELRRLVRRLRHVVFTSSDLQRETAALESDLQDRFEIKRPLVPMSWLVTKTFRHVGDPYRGADPAAIAALPVDRVQAEWGRRRHPGNITAVIIGDINAEDGAVRVAAREAFGSIEPAGAIPTEVTVQPVGNVRREIFVPHLPGDDDHIAIAFYAPPITDPAHPAFLAMSQQFIDDARAMPGADARLPYQYSMLLDPRAAYLTPHAWRFPKGPGQAGGYWLDKIAKRRFANAIGRGTLGRLIWQLGGEMKEEFIEEVARSPELLYTLGYATAFREAYGDDAFWENYRANLYRIRGRDLEDLRKRFYADTNRTLFVLRATDAAPNGEGGGGATPPPPLPPGWNRRTR